MCTVGSYTHVTLSNTEIYVTHIHTSQLNTRPCLVLGKVVKYIYIKNQMKSAQNKALIK